LTVVFRSGMNVVRGLIVILDLYGLAGHHAQHVRMVLAAALVEDNSVFRNVEGAATQYILYIYEHAGEIAAAGYDGLRFVGAFAGGVLAHVDLGLFRGCAVELHCAVHGCDCRRIDGSGRWSGRRRLRHGVGWLFFFLATGYCEQQQSAQSQGAGRKSPTAFLIHDVLLSFSIVVNSRNTCHPARSEGSWFLPSLRGLPPQANTKIPRFARDDSPRGEVFTEPVILPRTAAGCLVRLYGRLP